MNYEQCYQDIIHVMIQTETTAKSEARIAKRGCLRPDGATSREADVLLNLKQYKVEEAVYNSFKYTAFLSYTREGVKDRFTVMMDMLMPKKLFEKMTDEQKIFIEYLNPLNIEARYPEYKKRLLEILTREKCEDILAGTEALVCWRKEQL